MTYSGTLHPNASLLLLPSYSRTTLTYSIHPWLSRAQISNFIDEALEKGDSVLVHSLDGTGRCIACLAAYLMCRFYWGFEKALEFLCSKRPDASPNNGFTQQVTRCLPSNAFSILPRVVHIGVQACFMHPFLDLQSHFKSPNGRIACCRQMRETATLLLAAIQSGCETLSAEVWRGQGAPENRASSTRSVGSHRP